MAELTPVQLLQTAYLLTGKIFPKPKLTGEELLTLLTNSTIEELQEETGLSEEHLGKFLNQTVPCMMSETKKAALNPNATMYESWDNIWLNCFFYVFNPTTTTTAMPVYDCQQYGLNSLIRLTMFVISIVLLLIMTFCVQKRRRACLDCCFGFPGPVVPLNMLDSYENRKGYVLAFGVTVNSIISIIFGDNKLLLGYWLDSKVSAFTKDFPFFSVLIKIFMSIYVAMMSYPFFVAQNMRNKLIGSILGLIFACYWFGFELFKMYVLASTCFKNYRQTGTESQQVFYVFYDVPKYICLLLLCIKFTYVLVVTIKKRQEKKKQGVKVNWFHEDDSNWREEYMYIHVKEVFKKHTIRDDEEDLDDLPLKMKMYKKVKSLLYVVKPGFKYSTRFLIAIFVGFLAVYAAFIIFAGFGYYLFNILLDQVILQNDLVDWISTNYKFPKQDILDYGRAIGVSFWLGMATSLILYVLVVMNQFTWYRRHVLALRRGERSFLPSGIRKKTLAAPTLMTSSFKYAGFQVGYCIWGFIISSAIFWLAWMVIVTQIFLPMKRKELSFLLTILIRQWPNILVAIVMMVAQMLLSRCCFVMSNDSMAVDNRRAYHIFSYFMFYFNVFLGLVSCLIRILLGLVLGVIFMQRLAKSTLPRSYERRDPGYLSYVSFLMLENQHANPVLQCFVRLLLETKNIQLKDEFFKNERQIKNSSSTRALICLDENIASKAKAVRNNSIRARNRWHLFVMMTMNPSIIRYRIRFMKVKKEKKFLAAKLNGIFDESTFDVADEEMKNIDGDTKSNNSVFMTSPNILEVKQSPNTNQENGEIKYRFKGDVESNQKCYEEEKMAI